MSMDFSKLGSTKKAAVPKDPIKIFEALPSLKDTPNDLWRGQAQALAEWHAVREENDVLISLNTGAGKTIAGLLVAQSLVNEGVANVVYVCSTIDLVNQTVREAKKIGIPCTTRTAGTFSDDLFESEKAFCVTTYHALFNGYSAIRRKHFPGAIIFDDAHVAEGILRDSFTMRVTLRGEEDLFNEIRTLFEPAFREIGKLGQFRDACGLERHNTAFVPPRYLQERAERLREILLRHGVQDHSDLKYPFAHLQDNLAVCAAIFTRGVFEVGPCFLPSLALDVFGNNVRRIYLSATLQSKTDFIRAFGRLPAATIEPANDAGNGERLILSGEKIPTGFDKDFVAKISDEDKIVIAVPDYQSAEKWEDIVEAPKREEFTEALSDFRGQDKGAFALVSRVDGIDLPHDTCRIMLIEDIPTSSSLIERYQWEYLRMSKVQSVRTANRVAQLFGRINRGRNDYGVFLLEGRDINIWMKKDRNVALLPPLLQKQILVGRAVQDGLEIDTTDKAREVMSRVLNRDPDWIDYYEREVKLGELDEDEVRKSQEAQEYMIEAAEIEAKFAAALWNGDYARARQFLSSSVDQTAKNDTPLGGWHGLWLGGTYDLEGDTASADAAYRLARTRIGPAITIPAVAPVAANDSWPELNEFGASLRSFLGYTNAAKIDAEITKLREGLGFITGRSTNQSEASVRLLGEVLGFNAVRPDNDFQTGPDVLWVDEVNSQILGFELKTDKDDPATYFKKDVSQGHDHISWMQTAYPNFDYLGLVFVGPDGVVDPQANPVESMGLCITADLCALRDQLLALIDDLLGFTPLERIPAIETESADAKWTLVQLRNAIWSRAMTEMAKK